MVIASVFFIYGCIKCNISMLLYNKTFSVVSFLIWFLFDFGCLIFNSIFWLTNYNVVCMVTLILCVNTKLFVFKKINDPEKVSLLVNIFIRLTFLKVLSYVTTKIYANIINASKQKFPFKTHILCHVTLFNRNV